MAEQRISRRYAKALIVSAQEAGSVKEVYDDLIGVKRTLDSSRELEVYLKSPLIKSLDKKKVIDEIFSSKVSKLTKDFLVLLAHKGREGLIPSIVDQFVFIYNTENDILPIEVTTAVEISEDIKNSILTEIKNRTGMNVQGSFKLDPSIKGGVVIKMDDMVIDASLRNKLNDLYKRLAAGEAA